VNAVTFARATCSGLGAHSRSPSDTSGFTQVTLAHAGAAGNAGCPAGPRFVNPHKPLASGSARAHKIVLLTPRS
jgi:hypothetical protein